MAIPDEPMLALMARFVGTEIAELELSNEDYLQRQFDEIKAYIKNFPEQAQEQAALDWIREHAEHYRRQWQKLTLSKLLLDQRCADCPLIDDGSEAACMIHNRWVGLLKEYIAGGIGADRYIEETLRLLNEHKNELKISKLSSKLSA